MSALWISVALCFCLKVYFSKAAASDLCTDASPWQPSWLQLKRDDLLCKDLCFSDDLHYKKDEQCCVCNSCTTWEGDEVDLFLEDVSTTGKSIVLSSPPANDSQVYQIVRRYSEMTQLPINLCNNDDLTSQLSIFPDGLADISPYRERIVKIDLESNQLQTVGDLTCLKRLDGLNLQFNNIQFLSNDSFRELTFLRTLYLGGNRIKNMEPNIVSSNYMNIFHVDLSNNQLETVDMSNVHSEYPFCEINFSSNNIKEFVNEFGHSLDTNKKYGPGFVNYRNNTIKQFPDFKTLLRLDELSQLGNLWDFGFDFRGSPLNCNCHVEPFMSLSEDIVKSLWVDYFNVTCAEPAHLAGMPIHQVKLSQFVCHLDAESGCFTPECTCVDVPHKNTLFIDCSYAGLTTFPPSVPISNISSNIAMNLSGNSITQIPNVAYLSKLSVLDLSNNALQDISEDIAGKLENSTLINLENNKHLLYLPQKFQYRQPCSTVLNNLIVNCDCSSVWIAEWLTSKKCKNQTSQFFCDVSDRGIIPALSFDGNDLDCFRGNKLYVNVIISIASITTFLVVTGSVIAKLRYEILVIYLRLRRRTSSQIYLDFSYDVYISLDEENDSVRNWVSRDLYKYLTESEYRVFLPYKDILPGGVRENEVQLAIAQSRSVLVVFSTDYYRSHDNERRVTEYEFNYTWYYYKTDKRRNVVFVNFDHISSFDVKSAKVRAFLRVGCGTDFGNHERNIMEVIQRKLGMPQRTVRQTIARPQFKLQNTLSLLDIEFDT